MQYVLVEIIGLKLMPLTYEAPDEVQLYDVLSLKVKGKKHLGIVLATNQEVTCAEYTITQATFSEYHLSQIQKTLLTFISSYYLQQIGISAQIFTLAQNQVLSEKQKSKTTNLKQLSEDQEKILNQCMKRPVSLIFGVTGSGKTEIYFHAIKECIEQGKQALFLMPEISLTPQIQKRLNEAFPTQSDIWHSKRTTLQKQKILQSLQNGKIQIIAGARSALFLPYKNLGLIIVDEEHDDSYKSNANPKYHARDLAIYLSTKGIQVILGSATPSVKSYYLAKQKDYLFVLKNKFFNSQQSLTCDITNNIGITDHVLHEIRTSLTQKKQIIIFIPTRANFKILICKACKNKIECPNCSITLSVHHKKQAMVCHYCNFMQKIPLQCPVCEDEELSGMRMGTEEFKKQLEEALKHINLTPTIALFDRDNITTQNKLEQLFISFQNHKIDILIGTQMIAKGHDYHNVDLSVIIGIDYMLNMPDYRSYETGFALLYQVAGRSGRKENGKILIQTKDPESIYALWGDYKKVIEHELHERLNLYPPFFRLALVSFAHKNEREAKELAHKFAHILHYLQELQTLPFTTRNIEIIGICEAPIPKIKNKFYYQVLLRSNENFALQQILKESMKYITADIRDSLDIDIDPLLL